MCIKGKRFELEEYKQTVNAEKKTHQHLVMCVAGPFFSSVVNFQQKSEELKYWKSLRKSFRRQENTWLKIKYMWKNVQRSLTYGWS